jgi:hypothetical protein
VGASSPQADLKPAMIAFTLLLCMKNKQKPTKTYLHGKCGMKKGMEGGENERRRKG